MVTLFSKSSLRGGGGYSRGGMGQPPAKHKVPLRFDPVFVTVSIAFVILGLLFTYSASGFETTSFVIRQAVFVGIGSIGAYILAHYFTPLFQLKKQIPAVLLYITWGLLILALFMPSQAHTHRWININGIQLQPSEIAKVTLVLYVANCLEETAGKLAKSWKFLLKPLLATVVTLGLIGAAKDLGTPALMGFVFLAMLFVSGARMSHLAVLSAAASAAGVIFMLVEPYRRLRLLAFLHLIEDTSAGVSYQVMQSFMAVGSGGWLGKGLGKSELKLQYLPAAHTDFIFSVMCEEIGLLVLLAVFGFALLLWRGIVLAKRAKTMFNSMVIFGLTVTLCAQAFFNMAMAIGLTPTKGIALPFFSYGGSSVVMTLAMVGIILNLAAIDHTQKNVRTDRFYSPRSRRP